MKSGDAIQFSVHGLQRAGGLSGMTVEETPVEEQMKIEFGDVVPCEPVTDDCKWRFSGDPYVIDQFNVIQNEGSQIIMVKQIPDGESKIPYPWLYFKLTLDSVNDPLVKKEIWSKRLNDQGVEQSYFAIQYQIENLDTPQIYYIETYPHYGWQTEKSTDW